MMLLDAIGIHVAGLMLLQWISVCIGHMLLTFQTDFVNFTIWHFLIRINLPKGMELILVWRLTIAKTRVLADSRNRFLKRCIFGRHGHMENGPIAESVYRSCLIAPGSVSSFGVAHYR